jgi:hypothetical protein
MKAPSINKTQSVELCDDVGKMLVMELEAEGVKNKVKKMVSDYVKKNKIDDDPMDLSNKLRYSVKVSLEK